MTQKKTGLLLERAYGVIPGEGSHGEVVKEYYFYFDSTPTHSYMKYLYSTSALATRNRKNGESNRRDVSIATSLEVSAAN